jgi:hydrogenase maturation protein HypF
MGVRQTVAYEGQAAVEMEALASPHENDRYPFEISTVPGLIDPAPIWAALLADWQAGIGLPTLSARFHNTVVEMAVQACEQIRLAQGIRVVALSGGVWQNRYLLERTLNRLEAAGFQVLVHRQLPPNDGCIALGQVMVGMGQHNRS